MDIRITIKKGAYSEGSGEPAAPWWGSCGGKTPAEGVAENARSAFEARGRLPPYSEYQLGK